MEACVLLLHILVPKRLPHKLIILSHVGQAANIRI